MIDDAHVVERDTRLEADVCVVGAGAAGIAMTLDLTARGLSVVLLESGSFREDRRTQALYEGDVADTRMHSPPDKYRQRRFGGSTTIWGGRCMPFDPIDFEPRSYIPDSGWPIRYQDVAAHYPQANELLEAGEFQYDADKVFDAATSALFDGFHDDRVLTNSLERFSCPTDLAKRYDRRLALATNVRVLLHANCTAIRLSRDGMSVHEVSVGTLAGNRFKVAAAKVVLAVGGLEIPRLLLASRDVHVNGIGNLHDVVGRYYMCHMAGNTGTLTVNGPRSTVRHGYLVSPDGIYCRRRISLSASEQRRLRVANTVARLHFPRITDPAHRSGVLSGLFLARRLISYEYGKRLNDGTSPGWRGYARHVTNVVSNPFDTVRFLSHWVSKRTLAQRKYPSVILPNRSNRFSLDVHGEQQPQADSRVRLAGSVDALGIPRIHVDWRYRADDVESVKRTLEAFARAFRGHGQLDLRYDPDVVEEDMVRFGAYGGHHIGTARMGNDPRRSVVNGDCRVHGIGNLYLAGAAVFPTSSQANPTLTIVALALRLSQHLADQLGSAKPSSESRLAFEGG